MCLHIGFEQRIYDIGFEFLLLRYTYFFYFSQDSLLLISQSELMNHCAAAVETSAGNASQSIAVRKFAQ